MEHRWNIAGARAGPGASKKIRASALERQVSVRSYGTKQQLGIGHNLGRQNSRFYLNRTWDVMLLGFVQGLALQK
jgi:hypothetical protein